MSKTLVRQESVRSNSLLRSFLSTGLYKRTQGRTARFATLVALIAAFGLGAVRMYGLWPSLPSYFRSLFPFRGANMVVPGLMFAIGFWFCQRLVNLPKFADFLISVEAEMNKVSWPTRTEVIRSAIVVIVMIATLVVVLFLFDVFWRTLLTDVLRIIQPPAAPEAGG